MFICTQCGHLVDEPRVIRERHGSPYGYEEYYDFCSCGGEYAPAVPCDECGEYVAEEDTYNTDDGRTICSECKNAEEYVEYSVVLITA